MKRNMIETLRKYDERFLTEEERTALWKRLKEIPKSKPRTL